MPAKPSPAYIRDAVFDSGYVGRQRPALLSYVAATAGFAPPDPSAAYAYLELGCSIGATLNGLAASNPHARYIGIDFNREHIEIARSDAAAANLGNVDYIEASFEDVLEHDLPDFDYIAINGTYSWLDPNAKSAVDTIVQRHLRDGGLFYVDYMALPGKAAVSPVWYLMRALTGECADGSEARVTRGMDLLTALDEADAGYFAKNPHARDLLDHWRKAIAASPASVRQLAHNALAEHWQPYYFSQIADMFQALDLSFAGSTLLDQNDLELALPAALRRSFAPGEDAVHMELVKDVFHYRQQRHDVFVKAGAQTGAAAQDYLSQKLHLMVIGDWRGTSWEFRGPDESQVDVDDVLIEGILQAATTGASTIAQMQDRESMVGYPREQLLAAVSKLVTKPNVEVFVERPVEPVSDDAGRLRAASDYNANAVERVIRHGGNLRVAGPAFGGLYRISPAAVRGDLGLCEGGHPHARTRRRRRCGAPNARRLRHRRQAGGRVGRR